MEGLRIQESPTYLIQATVLDTVTYMACKQYQVLPTVGIGNELIWFIPVTFLFEVLFDFFHYWTHRISHTNKWLYRHVHSVHHSTTNLWEASAFKHHVGDLIMTNVLPIVLAGWIFPLRSYTFTAFFWYKSMQEIAGHSGKDMRSSSFAQCKWVPELLGIPLYSRNHHEHHRNTRVNFSKRFSLWDRVFGTFQD